MSFERRDPRNIQMNVKFTTEEKKKIDKFLKEKRKGMPFAEFLRECVAKILKNEGEKE